MFKRLVILTAFFCLYNAKATLNLELTQGISKAVPVAIVPFKTSEDTAKVQLDKLLSQDLQYSGQFHLQDSKTFKQHPHTAQSLNINYWRKRGVNYVVVGSIKSLGYRRYQAHIALVNIFAASGEQSSQTVLFDRDFTITQRQIRQLAHHVSDLIYREITGKPGIFSTRLAYVEVQRTPGQKTRFSLEVSDFDGHDAHPILVSQEPILSPTWDPKGERIAYVSFEAKQPEIYISNLVTGERFKLTHFEGINGAPAWSPDGQKMALVLSKTGAPEIYVLDLESKKLTQLTFGDAINTEPAWFPNGQSIIFTSNRGGSPQIYKVSLKTKKIERMTFKGDYNARGSISADGHSMVLLHRQDGLYNIAIQDLKTGVMQTITQTGLDESPSFAPNGQMIVYATRYGGRGVLGAVSIDGRVKLRLPAELGNVQEPAWSPY